LEARSLAWEKRGEGDGQQKAYTETRGSTHGNLRKVGGLGPEEGGGLKGISGDHKKESYLLRKNNHPMACRYLNLLWGGGGGGEQTEGKLLETILILKKGGPKKDRCRTQK